MRLVTLLSVETEQVVARTCAHRLPVTHVRSLEQLDEELGRATAVIVLDPLSLSEAAFDDFLAAAARSTAPVLFLAGMNAASAHRIAAAAHRGIGDVILADREDIALLLDTKLRAGAEPPASTKVLRALAPEASALPHPVSLHVMALFCGAHVPLDVSRFAAWAQVPRRSLHRELTRVGLAGAGMLLAVARLARTWEQVGRRPVDSDTHATGEFPTHRELHAQYLRLVGLPPGRAAHELSIDAFAARLARFARGAPPKDEHGGHG